jgi:predicted phosphodiesterase
MTLIAVFSDAHGNAEALKKGIRIARQAGAQRLYFLGDAVGYISGGDAIDLLLENRVVCTKGNHEDMLLNGACDVAREAVYKIGRTRNALSGRQIEAIRRWPDKLRIRMDIGEAGACHGSPDDPIYGYVYPDTPPTERWGDEAPVWFFANTHRPFIRNTSACLLINVGSIGLPRDFGTLASLCLFDTETRVARIVRFDISRELAQAFSRAGDVHPSVETLLARRSPGEPFGERIDESS